MTLDFDDDRPALAYAELAASRGSVAAHRLLGKMYEYRKSVFYSVSRALHWYDLAASLGDREAGTLSADLRELIERGGPDMDLIEAVLREPTKENIRALLEDDLTVMTVKKDEDVMLVAWNVDLYFSTGELDAKWRDFEPDDGRPSELVLGFKDKRLQVPLTQTPADRHITLCTVNEILAPEYEIRYCIDTPDGADPVFMPLTREEWAQLETAHGPAVARHFLKLTRDRDVFAEQVLRPEAPSPLSRFLGWLSPARPARSR
jgi:hypothetical protein